MRCPCGAHARLHEALCDGGLARVGLSPQLACHPHIPLGSESKVMLRLEAVCNDGGAPHHTVHRARVKQRRVCVRVAAELRPPLRPRGLAGTRGCGGGRCVRLCVRRCGVAEVVADEAVTEARVHRHCREEGLAQGGREGGRGAVKRDWGGAAGGRGAARASSGSSLRSKMRLQRCASGSSTRYLAKSAARMAQGEPA